LRRTPLGADNGGMGALGRRSIAGLSGINASLTATERIGDARAHGDPPAMALYPEGRR
jgi:hypothetical protein